eukprot:CAMPEP_0181296896 /NCGR_PEP_ID=MMETSP1101-20121128/4947_1 /TAXON_ID=46948 /ORGANISM="Rhodomonas abbreviata, Strain Caron Lab Isolate" /LENGTH=288 /DNA_ID=CAMNT_0023401789 /DNA_START=243 /DNA_END=1106 /DNA_ORIENTATION=+
MTEEVAFLDEEMTKIVEEIQAGLTKLQENKGTNVDRRMERTDHLKSRISRAKEILKQYHLEMQNVKLEGGTAFDSYQKKRLVHVETVDKLLKDVDVANRAAERKELMADKAGRAVKSKKFEAGAAGADETIEHGKRVQEQTMGALERTEKLVEEMQGIGKETNEKLSQQTDQIKATNQDVNAVNEGINAAGKKVKDIARRLATDKMIMCMILMLILAIIGIIVVQSLGLVDNGSGEIDCSLDITMLNRDCKEAESAKSGGGTAPPPPVVVGNATGNSTRRLLWETSSP